MKINGINLGAIALSLLLMPAVSFAAPKAELLLKKAEDIRHPQEDYTVKVYLSDSSKSKGQAKTVKREFTTLIKGHDKALVKYEKPITDLGKEVLMVKSDMWIYMPKSAKPIRISPKQKMAGNASYGDITRLNFVGNYQPEYVKKSKFKGKAVHVLSLKAIKGQSVTYSQIEYWIEAKSKRPVKALYQTKSGKTLKVAYYEDYQNVFGVQRPTALRIVDKIRKNNVTVIKFENAKKTSLPGILFEKQNMGRG
jgi:hypothetical protein